MDVKKHTAVSSYQSIVVAVVGNDGETGKIMYIVPTVIGTGVSKETAPQKTN